MARGSITSSVTQLEQAGRTEARGGGGAAGGGRGGVCSVGKAEGGGNGSGRGVAAKKVAACERGREAAWYGDGGRPDLIALAPTLT